MWHRVARCRTYFTRKSKDIAGKRQIPSLRPPLSVTRKSAAGCASNSPPHLAARLVLDRHHADQITQDRSRLGETGKASDVVRASTHAYLPMSPGKSLGRHVDEPRG